MYIPRTIGKHTTARAGKLINEFYEPKRRRKPSSYCRKGKRRGEKSIINKTAFTIIR